MALPLYLAMTEAEILENGGFPSAFGWLCSAAALEEMSARCPDGGMLILTDEQPFTAELVQRMLADLDRLVKVHRIESVLLDFQRPNDPGAKVFTKAASQILECPVGVSAIYAGDGNCAVVMPPVPPNVPAAEYLRPWQGREIWLEAALDGMVISVTESGTSCQTQLRGKPANGEHWDPELLCHYRVEIGSSAVFTLRRSREDLRELLLRAEKLGVNRAVGLYQELADLCP